MVLESMQEENKRDYLVFYDAVSVGTTFRHRQGRRKSTHGKFQTSTSDARYIAYTASNAIDILASLAWRTRWEVTQWLAV